MTTVSLGDSRYPSLLGRICKPPDPLYAEGELTACRQPLLSVVGSRKMSAYGRRVIDRLLPAAVRAGIGIVSGLAYGVDSYAHRVAVRNGGRCVVVLGSGLQRIYPSSNAPLLREIVRAGGCALSEFPPDTPPLAAHFPQRNRIVAGLSPLTLIIEAGERSGTLITARCALEEGRDVGAVPGEIDGELSQGVHRLLKDGAALIAGPEDVLELYGLQATVETIVPPSLTGEQKDLYDLVSCGCTTPDQLAERSGLTIGMTCGVLSELEAAGLIQLKDMRWQRIS